MRTPLLSLLLPLLLVGVTAGRAGGPAGSGRDEIDAFNRHYVELHLKMDTDAILALWADDGVDLMPGEAPIVGRAAISAWVKDAVAKIPGAKLTRMDLDFHDIRVSGDWASEWATEHQTVEIPGKPTFDGYGKMALILHRDKDHHWKIQQEMWNAAPPNESAK